MEGFRKDYLVFFGRVRVGLEEKYLYSIRGMNINILSLEIGFFLIF